MKNKIFKGIIATSIFVCVILNSTSFMFLNHSNHISLYSNDDYLEVKSK